MNRTALYLGTSLLATLVLGTCAFAWWQGVRGEVGRYELFPLLGLMAWGLMWTHYVSGSLKRYLGLAGDEAVLRTYTRVTGIIVLALILLHPALLYSGLFEDGLGLPPFSALAAYTTSGTRAALVLAWLSLPIFLAFEFKRRYGSRSWWRSIEYANMAAMLLIFFHAFLIGGELVSGWFRLAWIGFGWLLVMSFVYNYWYDKQRRKREVHHGTN